MNHASIQLPGPNGCFYPGCIADFGLHYHVLDEPDIEHNLSVNGWCVTKMSYTEFGAGDKLEKRWVVAFNPDDRPRQLAQAYANNIYRARVARNKQQWVQFPDGFKIKKSEV